MIKTYKDIEYIIYWSNQDEHYNGYVKLPDNHKFLEFIDDKSEVFGEKLSTGYDKMTVAVHGGLTFSERIIKENIKDFPQEFNLGCWIGWDYAHSGDNTKFMVGKKWTKEEIEQECKNVIDQLLEI